MPRATSSLLLGCGHCPVPTPRAQHLTDESSTQRSPSPHGPRRPDTMVSPENTALPSGLGKPHSHGPAVSRKRLQTMAVFHVTAAMGEGAAVPLLCRVLNGIPS